ncbi:MAG TPA: glycosyltransferase family 4 protein, partial [Solirubrobacteraceae bacterium]|nr:glycosyltransferase family 4 protein [Solirubrobacteraceae bacterium]
GRLAPGLAARGVEVHVLTRGPAGMPAVSEVEGVVVHRVAEPPRPDHVARFVAWIERMNDHLLATGVRLARDVDVDVDLVHGHDWVVARAADRLASRLGCPLAMTVHATEHGRHRGWVGAPPQSHIHAVERRAIDRADRLIVCSDYMRGHLADVFGVEESEVEVIANGVEPARVGPGRRSRGGERLVLLAGRLVYEKGFQLAIDALPGLRRRVGPVRLVIAGAGMHEPELRAQVAALGLAGQVDFLGWVGPALVEELYAAADVCVVPSIYEPFGLVALEAMAHGCPCVAADTGGLREVVPHGVAGLRFRAGDPASLEAMVALVLGDRVLRERLAAGAAAHVARFDWAVVAARTAGVYDALVRARRPAVLGPGQ